MASADGEGVTQTSALAAADRIVAILKSAKALAQEYKKLTGKPLGITGEVAEYEAARILDLELTPARQAGYDAIEGSELGARRLQIKGRCLENNCKPGQRIGRIDLKKDWDAVLLVLLDEDFEATEIWEADRAPVEAALKAPGSKSRNERGALAVSKFKSLGRRRWQRHTDYSIAAMVDVNVPVNTREVVPPMATQREKMRQLFHQCSHDEEKTVHAYALAERKGEVTRASNNYEMNDLDYARRLYADGIRKGWLK
jgi:hypothetical protein